MNPTFRFCVPTIFGFMVFSCATNSTPEDFQIEKGFQLKLVASEPLIKDPVDLEFNENGDALVLEMPGYPFEDKQSRIVLLEDGDSDGVYDGATIYLENLQMATSILPYKSGVLIAAPPYLLHAKDSNKDYKIDVVDTLMGGFATENLQHNYNGLTYGLDNWIYAANGGNSGKPYWWGDTTTVIDLRGDDLRFNLESRVMERLGESSGGFGLGMDEFGRLFETHNLTHISHLVFPARYMKGAELLKGHSLSNISDHEEDGLARIYPIGEQESRVNHPEQSGYFSGACGVTYYGGGALGPDFDNTIWVADVVLNLIHVDKLKPNGASISATRLFEKKDFLASTDRSFRPVNMSVGPDGSMYVVDMHRKVIEHPEWIPDEIEKTLDINAGKDKGRIYKIRKTNVSASFEINQLKTTEGMVSSLKHPNQWVRKTAHRLLMEKPLDSEQLELLNQLINSENVFGRLHSLWILHGQQKLNNQQLSKVLQDASPGVRENALTVAEEYLHSDESILKQCLVLLNDDNQRVRMRAALTISTVTPAIFDKNKTEILNALAAASKSATDDWNVAAITLAANGAAAELFSKVLSSDGKPNEPLLASLARACGNTPSGIQIVLQSLNGTKLNSETKSNIIRQLTKGTSVQVPKTIIPFLQKIEGTGEIALVSELAAFRKKIGLPPSPEFLTLSRDALGSVLNHSLPDSVRLKQMSLIEFLPYREKANVLFACLKNTEPMKIQEAALRQLATYQEVEIGQRIVKLWQELGPQTRRLASDLLLYIEIHNDALLTGLENKTINIGEMNFDLERRRTLLWWTDDKNIKRRAEALFSDVGVTNRKEAMEKMKGVLSLKGSSASGATVFETICSNCHVYGSQGKDVGPVLTEIKRKSKELLLHDILDPNAAAETKYISHRLETKSGAVHIGIVDEETDAMVTIKKMGGEKATVQKSDIKKFSSLGTSLMMEGLEGSMTQQEMADLLAFLQTGN
jgi:putative membrane-bound dehydrogenase-like protein